METSSKAKDIQQEALECKTKLTSLQKFLSKKSGGREKLMASEYAQIKQTLKTANSAGLRLIERQENATALELLRQAETVASLFFKTAEQGGESAPALKLLTNTYNNIGYLFSQAGDLDNAYKYLIKTLEAQTRAEYSSQKKGLTCLNLANTLMSNVCASVEMKKHKECSKFATRAIKEFQTTLANGEDIDSPDVRLRGEA